MIVAFIGQKGIPATFGGVEYHVDRLTRELAGQGHDVRVYVRSWYTDRKLKTHRGVSLVHVPTLKTKHLDATVHSLLSSVHVVFTRAKIVHYHCAGPALFSFIPRLFGKKVVCTIHRKDWLTRKWGRTARLFLRVGERVAARTAHTVIVVSKGLRTYLQSTYNRKSVHITHGVDIPEICAPRKILQEYGLKGKDYLLFMGRLSPEKRVEWVIRAYRETQEQRADASDFPSLVIAGGSSATPEYVDMLKTQAGRHARIRFTGYVTGRLKTELLSNALIFLMPSELEGFPIALLEAKSYGICCLVSDIPPHREAIEHGRNGWMFPHQQFSDFSRMLAERLDDPAGTLATGERARKEMENSPAWKTVAAETAVVYRRLLPDDPA